jgi:hypothetical protein
MLNITDLETAVLIMFCERLQNIFGILMVPHYLQILLTISVEKCFGYFWNFLAVFYLTKLNRFLITG